MSACCSSKKKRLQHLLSENVDTLLTLRMSDSEKFFHTNKFFDWAEENSVTRENFPNLMGFFGTSIAQNFALRIFDIFSGDKKSITLGEYLKYIDIYQHGENYERCLITFKLMDSDNNQTVSEKEFIDYIKLMISAIKMVHPSANEGLLTEKEMKILFNDISEGKPQFTFQEYQEVYEKKPLLLSWIDYFKQDEAEMFPNLDHSIVSLLKLQFNFFDQLGKVVEDSINKEIYDFSSAVKQIDKFVKLFEKQMDRIEKFKSRINIRNIMDKLKHQKKESTAASETKRRKSLLSFNRSNSLNKNIDFNDKKPKKTTETFNNINIINEEKNEESKYFDNEKLQTPLREVPDEEIHEIKEHQNTILVNEHLKLLRNTLNPLGISNSPNKNPQDDQHCDTINSEEKIDAKYLSKYKCISQTPGKNMLVVKDIKIEMFDIEENLKEIKNKSIDEEKKEMPFLPYEFRNFFKKMKTLCDVNVTCLLVIFKFYNAVSRKFIKKKHLKKQNLNDDLRISKTNIPNKTIKPKIKSKNNILNPGDSNFKIILTMIMGIQKTIQTTPNIDIDHNSDLNPLMKSLKYSLGEAFIHSKEQYYIKDYGGIIFNNIRKLYNIDMKSFINSISPQDMITELMISYTTNIEQLCSTGNSGSLFYYTRDAKYILKTIQKREFEVLKRILPDYFRYLKNNKWTLLPKFFGCFKLVKKENKKRTRYYFTIMDNLFSTNKEIYYRYDLKGSTVGRKVFKNGEKFDEKMKYDFAFKDLDLEENKHVFTLGDKRKKLIDQMKKDTEFLKSKNIIDYSLLVGSHVIFHENKPEIQFIPSFNQNEFIYSTQNKENLHVVEDKSLIGSAQKKVKFLEPGINKSPIASFHYRGPSFNIENDDKKPEISASSLNSIPDILFLEESAYEDTDLLENVKDIHPFKDFTDGGILSQEKREIFYIGIIDILTEFSVGKKCEYLAKLSVNCNQKFSCIPAGSYQERFVNYMQKKIVEKKQN